MTSIQVFLFIWSSCMEILYRLKKIIQFDNWPNTLLCKATYLIPMILSYLFDWSISYHLFRWSRPYLFVRYPLTSLYPKNKLYQVKFISWNTDPSLVCQKYWSFVVSYDLSFILGLVSLPSVAVPQYIIYKLFSQPCVLYMYSILQCTLWGEKTNAQTCVGCMISSIGLATSLC